MSRCRAASGHDRWHRRSALLWAATLGVAWLGASPQAMATGLRLKDGRRLEGKIGKVAGLAENPLAPNGNKVETITFVDDNLRRVFIPTYRIAKVEEELGEVKEKIGLDQRVAHTGSVVRRLGPITKITPFDEHGHRTVTMQSDKGPLSIVQGISILSPVWTKVEGLTTKGRTPIVWDMRIATSSIPLETLNAILRRRIDPKNLEQRLKVVRLFLQAERYQDAERVLQGVIKDFPNQEQLAAEVKALHQLYARSIVKEIEVRRKAGQHPFAYALLEQFPTEDVAGDTLEQVKEMLDAYRDAQTKLQKMHADLSSEIRALNDPGWRAECEAMLKEMTQELGINTIDRLAGYQRLADDPALSAEQKVALAISGWLMGTDQAETNLNVALSLVKIRELVQRYLSEPVKLERGHLFDQLRGQEGASPPLIAQLIAHMKPPLATPAPSVATPGYYKFQIPVGIEKEADVTYFVQLPPGYDPHLRYPTILTLNGAGSTAEQQVDWWAGSFDANGNRTGQATRLGYIVVAVDWLKDAQQKYEYSAREHAAVLTSLRDACRRFSIDTDRVFLSGHSAGGSAAWDLGLAHPDLWAGVIPIVARADKYCARYWENAELVPFYVLGGEMDGDATINNARDLDRYMINRFDVTVVEYIGRGHEDFYEDILHIFDWMAHREPRNFFPKKFSVSLMRSWDNFFWWVEVGKLPARGIVEPDNWPPPRNTTPVKISANVLATNGVTTNGGLGNVTVWLSPEVVVFNRPMAVRVGSASILKGSRVEPDLQVLLEDVRTRADRQHPFWAKVEQ
jgi:acetyl esterase/lipase